MRRWIDRVAILLGLIVVVLIVREVIRPPTPPVLTITPRWKTGETRRYVVTSEVSRTKDGFTKRSAGTKVPVELRVIEVSDMGSVISWRMGRPREFDPRFDSIPIIVSLSDVVTDLDIELILDTSGAIRGVRNWRTIQERLRGIIRIVEKGPRFQSLTDEGKANERKLLAAMLDSEADIVYQVTDIARLVFAPEGLALRDDEATSCTRDLGNPLALMSLPWQMTFSLKSDGLDLKRAALHFTGTVRPADLVKAMGANLEQFKSRSRGREPSDELIRSTKISLDGNITIDPQSGWVESLEANKILEQGEVVEVMSYSLKTDGSDGQGVDGGR
jgi:hypothetical protein